MTMKKVLSLSFVLLCICACNNIWEEDFISNPINADENLLAAYFLKSYEGQYGIVWQESNVLPEHTLLTDYIELRYNGHNERYQYVIPALNGDNHLIDAYVVYPVNAVGDGLDKNLGRELGEMEFVASSCICSLPFHEKFGHSYYFLDWKEKGLDVQEGLYAYAKQICDYTKELVRADTLPSTKAYGETYTVSIEYELEPCTWVEGNEVFVSVPRPETVKQIILSCFDFYGTVVASREYTVRCRFHFMIQGNISEATLDLAMWDADSRLRREFGVCFLYYSADLSKMGGSSGSGSSSDSGTHIGGGGGSSNPGKNPDPPEGDDDITKNNFLEKVMTPQFKQKIRDELGVNPDKIPILLGSDLIHNAQTNMAYYSVDGNIHVYDECFTRGYSWDDMEAIMYHEYVHAKQHLVDGIELPRNENNEIIMQEYVVPVSQWDLNKEWEEVNAIMETMGISLNADERTPIEEDAFQFYKDMHVTPIENAIQNGETQIKECNKDAVLEDIEAYRRQLEQYEGRMSAKLTEQTKDNLDWCRYLWNVIKSQ